MFCILYVNSVLANYVECKTSADHKRSIVSCSKNLNILFTVSIYCWNMLLKCILRFIIFFIKFSFFFNLNWNIVTEFWKVFHNLCMKQDFSFLSHHVIGKLKGWYRKKWSSCFIFLLHKINKYARNSNINLHAHIIHSYDFMKGSTDKQKKKNCVSPALKI